MTRRMWLVVLSMLGIFIAAYLTLYKLGYIGSLICVGGSNSCEVVQTSKWSRLFGQPIAMWGLGYYLSVFVVSLASLQDRFAESRGLSLTLLLLTGWGAAFSGWLTYLEAGPIGAWCQWCVASAIIALLLFVVALMDWRANKAAGQ